MAIEMVEFHRTELKRDLAFIGVSILAGASCGASILKQPDMYQYFSTIGMFSLAAAAPAILFTCWNFYKIPTEVKEALGIPRIFLCYRRAIPG